MLRHRRARAGFTLIELLVVFVILALLVALLLPAIRGAVRSANQAKVQADMNTLAQALASFQNKYGTYPPSRILLSETGNYGVLNATTNPNGIPAAIYTPALAQRSVQFLRKLWPRLQVSLNQNTTTATFYYDWNGDGAPSPPRLLQGHECLVFFLGGLPVKTGSGFGLTGFATNPVNPAIPATANVPRSTPTFEFNAARLFDDDGNGFPGYLDGLGDPLGAGYAVPYIAYFASYGPSGYDPDDVNLAESAIATDGSTLVSIAGAFQCPAGASNTGFTSGAITRTDWSSSPSPNPYTSSVPLPAVVGGATAGTEDPASTVPTIWHKPTTFQLISPGTDRYYGLGGWYNGSTTTGVKKLPFHPEYDTANSDITGVTTLPTTIRDREQDNLTNFQQGTLGP